MRRSLIKKLFLKISQYSKKNSCVGVSSVLKLCQKEASTQDFFYEYYKIFKNTCFENICERLFERFPTGASNITRNMGIEENIFSKTKQKKNQNLAIWKNLYFYDALAHFVFLYFSTACLRRRLPYIIKHHLSKGL